MLATHKKVYNDSNSTPGMVRDGRKACPAVVRGAMKQAKGESI